MKTSCPHCKELIHDQVQKKYDHAIDRFALGMDCPKCGKFLKITVEHEPVFIVRSRGNESTFNPSTMDVADRQQL